MWSKKWQILLFSTIPKKFVLWVHHRIKRIKNQTSDEEVIKKRKLRNQRENEKNRNDDVDGLGNEGKEMHVYIKVANIHFNPPSKLAFKPNSFSYNLVLNCNLVGKLIPN